MAFALRYPDEISPSISWVPTTGPKADGHGEGHGPPAIVHRTADPRVFYAYYPAAAFDVYRYVFRGITDSDKANLLAFYDAVRASDFKVFDDAVGAYYVGRFDSAVIANGFADWAPFGASYWSVSVPIIRRS